MKRPPAWSTATSLRAGSDTRSNSNPRRIPPSQFSLNLELESYKGLALGPLRHRRRSAARRLASFATDADGDGAARARAAPCSRIRVHRCRLPRPAEWSPRFPEPDPPVHPHPIANSPSPSVVRRKRRGSANASSHRDPCRGGSFEVFISLLFLTPIAVAELVDRSPTPRLRLHLESLGGVAGGVGASAERASAPRIHHPISPSPLAMNPLARSGASAPPVRAP